MYTLFMNLQPKQFKDTLTKCDLLLLFKMCIKATKAIKYVEAFVQTFTMIMQKQ